MRVLPEQCRRDERWTYVSIAPGQETFNPNEYVRVLRDVEYDMWDDGQESVMLVPARAD